VLNACFKVFHEEGLSPERDFCAQQIYSVLSKSYSELKTPTVYLKTFDEVEEFYKEEPNFKFNYIAPKVEGGPSFPPNSGTVGVFASNYVAYKNLLKSNYEYLFLFEDDVVISPNFVNINERYMKELPEGWDFFTTFVPPDCLKWYNSDYELSGNTYVSRTYQDWSCAGYVVNRRSAAKAVADIEKNGINDPVDWYIFNSRLLNNNTNIYFNTYSPVPNAYHTVKFYENAFQSSTITGVLGTQDYD
jgi:hypothetical protein